MTTSITAVFEGGLLRPTTPLTLPEGTQVELILVSNGKSGKPTGRSAASILAEIAALPTAGGDPNSGLDHDRILYARELLENTWNTYRG